MGHWERSLANSCLDVCGVLVLSLLGLLTAKQFPVIEKSLALIHGSM
jgi:hypothetical protein